MKRINSRYCRLKRTTALKHQFYEKIPNLNSLFTVELARYHFTECCGWYFVDFEFQTRFKLLLVMLIGYAGSMATNHPSKLNAEGGSLSDVQSPTVASEFHHQTGFGTGEDRTQFTGNQRSKASAHHPPNNDHLESNGKCQVHTYTWTPVKDTVDLLYLPSITEHKTIYNDSRYNLQPSAVLIICTKSHDTSTCN